MALIKNLPIYVLLSIIIFNILGCTTIIIWGRATKNQSHASSYIYIPKNKGDIFDIASEVGGEMGYIEAARDNNLLILRDCSRYSLSDILAGVYNETDINIDKSDNILSITVIEVATYGNASDVYCNKVLNSFKNRLSLRLNPINH
jgi:hypothetical protein